MLTIDDINSINTKYKYCGFWVEIDVANIPSRQTDRPVRINGIYINRMISQYLVRIPHSLFYGVYYHTYADGTVSQSKLELRPVGENEYTLSPEYLTDGKLHFFFAPGDYDFDENWRPSAHLITPAQELIIPVINGKFDPKFYINVIGTAIRYYTRNGTIVSLSTDDKGTYINLGLGVRNKIIGVQGFRARNYQLYTVVLKGFKTLPILSIPTLYKGNTQTITCLTEDNKEMQVQAYYQGLLLKDNLINLPYDVDDYIDITVDILDNRYPNSTLKLKAPTIIYTANTQSDVETAITNGITTLQVGDNETEVLLNNIDLSGVRLINSNIQLTECTLTNCQLIDTTYTDNGGNTFTNTIIENNNITVTDVSTYNDCTLSNNIITDSELHITGTLTDNTFNNSLLISDGDINVTDNTFAGVGSKTYFPSFLYLTGDYTVTGNTFTMSATFEEAEFNMCLIKATNTFNVSEFAKQNNFNLNITYGEEPTNTLYYNIVDDDKIRAVRL